MLNTHSNLVEVPILILDHVRECVAMHNAGKLDLSKFVFKRGFLRFDICLTQMRNEIKVATKDYESSTEYCFVEKPKQIPKLVKKSFDIIKDHNGDFNVIEFGGYKALFLTKAIEYATNKGILYKFGFAECPNDLVSIPNMILKGSPATLIKMYCWLPE